MFNKIKRLFNKACEDFDLISKDDRILVGFSGGKDSLILLHFLHLLRENQNREFTLIAAHIRFSNLPYSVDFNYLKTFCQDREIEFHIVEDQIRKDHLSSSTCIHCSRYRRAKLMDLARIQNCNKLALGHHLDDVVTTLLMNMSQHGRFAGMAIKLGITVGDTKYPLVIIRPLCYVPETDLKQFLIERNYHSETCRCPWGDNGFRKRAQELVSLLSTKDENVRMNFFKAQLNICEKYLNGDFAKVHIKQTNDIEEAGTENDNKS